MEETRVLQAFLASFGAPVYAAYDVPPEAVFPRITWTPLWPGRQESEDLGVRLWMRGEGFETVMTLASAIGASVGAGRRLALPSGGALVLWRGAPFARVEGQPGALGVRCIRLALRVRRVS